MTIPNIWGQGQIFAFSALDGQTTRKDDFSGLLAGDRVGVRFHTKVRRELAVVGYKTEDMIFRAVCGDYICADTDVGCIKILFYAAHLIIGEVPEGATAVVFTEGSHKLLQTENITIQDTGDGEYTALCMQGRKFAFSFGKTTEDAARLAQQGIAVDIKAEEEKKISFYKAHSIENGYSSLYAKCLSVMKTQLFSPEAIFKSMWSTPDRLPHQDLWLWDSVFHAIGFRNIDGKIAEDLISSMLDSRLPDGRIPCRTRITENGIVTTIDSQAPIIAWGSWKVYKITDNKAFLNKVFEENSIFLKWCMENRRYSDGLYAWRVSETDMRCRCGESGMDNSPRFDDVEHLLAVDFSSFMANEMRYMTKIANELGKDSSFYDTEFEALKQSINTILWDEKSGYYFDYDADRKKLHKVKTLVSFLPLLAGVCNEENAAMLISHLTNQAEFYSEFPIPSVAKDDPTYGTDMWRGPVWLNYNYMICEGLREYGYGELAQEITDKTLKVVQEWYEKTGAIYEFYDSENKKAPFRLTRKGDAIEPYDIRVRVQTIRDFGWSCCLTMDMIANME